jgi:hypothetical protein
MTRLNDYWLDYLMSYRGLGMGSELGSGVCEMGRIFWGALGIHDIRVLVLQEVEHVSQSPVTGDGGALALRLRLTLTLGSRQLCFQYSFLFPIRT